MNDEVEWGPMVAVAIAAAVFVGCPGKAPQLDPDATASGGSSAGSGGQGGGGDCGDGVPGGGEACDDGNDDVGDGCRPDCTAETCGDGVIDPSMVCLADPVGYSGPAGAQPLLAPLETAVTDLVVFGSSLQVRLSNGTGSFGGAVTLAQATVQALAGHLDDDDALDLAVIQNDAAGAYLNDGDGTFGGLLAGAPTMTAGTGALGDLDEDGFDDLVVTGCVNGCTDPGSLIEIFLANGDGTFGAAATYAGNSSAMTLVRDVTGDGRRDVIALHFAEGGSVGVYPGDGQGAIGSAIQSAIPDNCDLNHMDLGDVDGDGWLDVVVSSGCDAKPIHILRGNGAGGFSEPVSLASSAGGTVSTQLADLDNDGNLDVITGTLGPSVLFFAGDGAGGFVEPVEIASALGGQAKLATADVDGDGALDLVVGASDGVKVYLSDP